MKLKRLSAKAWLARLQDPASRLDLNICRFWQRPRPWGSTHFDIEQHYCCFVDQGAVRIRSRDDELPLGPGQLSWVQPGDARGISGEAARHCNLRFGLFDKGVALRCNALPRMLSDAWQLLPFLRAIHDLDALETPHREVRLRGLLLAFTGAALALAREESSGGLSPAQRETVLRLARKNMARGLVPADLARAAGLSGDWFARRFRISFGLAPRSWLVRERMQQAAVLLEEQSGSVASIAQSLGIDSPQLFNRQFRAIHRCTPGVYRQRVCGGDRVRLP